MSWSKVFDYFNTHLAANGLVEWVEAFEDDNIPSTLIDGAFKQDLRLIVGDGLTNQSQETRINHIVTVYFKGFREPRLAQREALDRAEQIIKACLKHSNQKNEFKGVYFSDLSLEPLNSSQNDNIVKAIIQFDVRMFLCIE